MNIQIQLTAQSRRPEVDFSKLVFGTVFSDHMLVADYDGEQWHSPKIVPYGDIPMSPSISGLHYGQSIFEGMKAFRNLAGEVVVFRPDAHHERLNRSAERLCMPPIPEDLFWEGLSQLLQLDEAWVGAEPGSQLYIRPIYFATDPTLGVKASGAYKLIIFTCPVNSYYKDPVKVFVTDKYVRATTGGVGNVKMAGNYARTMKISKEKAEQGFHVVLWLDGVHRLYIDEFSTMNVFFVMDDVVVTPRLSGTILEGITRDTALTVLKAAGYALEERDVAISEIMEAGRNGRLQEAFGTGTAAVVSPVASMEYAGQTITLPNWSEWKVAPLFNDTLRKIRIGELPDTHHWLRKIR